MKQIVIIIIILIIIFGLSVWTQNFLSETSNTLVGKLEEVRSKIENKEVEAEDLLNQTEEIYKEWQDINERWSVVVLHDEIDLIETALIRMKSKIETGKLDESMEDLETSIFLLEHIKDKEKTDLKNIF